MPKGKQGFQKGHKPFNGIEKGQFKKGGISWRKNKTKEKYPQLKGYWKGRKRPEISKLKKGVKRSQEVKDKISKTLKGKTYKELGRKPISRKTKEKIRKGNMGQKRSEETKKRISDNCKGIKKPRLSELMKGKRGKLANNWQGGRVSLAERMRKYPEYKEWRTKVFKFDNYTCWICEMRGGELHPHHLMKLSLYPKLAFKISNGLTICKFCHKTYTNFNEKR